MGTPVWSEAKTGAKEYLRALKEILQQVQDERNKKFTIEFKTTMYQKAFLMIGAMV